MMRLMLDALCSVLDGVFFRNITLITRINTYLPRLGRTPAGTCPDGVFFGNIALLITRINTYLSRWCFFGNITLIARINTYLPRLGGAPLRVPVQMVFFFFGNITLITRINTYLPRLGRTPAGTWPDGVFLLISH